MGFQKVSLSPINGFFFVCCHREENLAMAIKVRQDNKQTLKWMLKKIETRETNVHVGRAVARILQSKSPPLQNPSEDLYQNGTQN